MFAGLSSIRTTNRNLRSLTIPNSHETASYTAQYPAVNRSVISSSSSPGCSSATGEAIYRVTSRMKGYYASISYRTPRISSTLPPLSSSAPSVSANHHIHHGMPYFVPVTSHSNAAFSLPKNGHRTVPSCSTRITGGITAPAK